MVVINVCSYFVPGWLPSAPSDQVSDGELCHRRDGTRCGAVLQGELVPRHGEDRRPVPGDDPTERRLAPKGRGVDCQVLGQPVDGVRQARNSSLIPSKMHGVGGGLSSLFVVNLSICFKNIHSSRYVKMLPSKFMIENQ